MKNFALPAGLLLVIAVAGWIFADDLVRLFQDNPAGTATVSTEAPGSNSSTSYLESRRQQLAAANPGSNPVLAARTDLILREVFMASDGEPASAIIQHLDTDADLFTTGNRVYDLAQLEEIHPDYVLLSENGESIRLPLKRLQGLAAASGSSPGTPGTGSAIGLDDVKNYKNHSIAEMAAMAATKIKRPADGEVAPALVPDPPLKFVSRLRTALAQAKEQSLANGSPAAWALLDLEPDVQQEQVNGLRLSGSQDSDFLAKYGLQEGDVITSVNGTRLDSREAATQARTTIGESKDLELVIERDHQAMTINITK